jgi:hypothetical protein
MTNKSKEITYFSLFLQVLFGCIYPDMCIAYSFDPVRVILHVLVFSFVKFLSCMDNATSYQTACCGVIDNVAILH